MYLKKGLIKKIFNKILNRSFGYSFYNEGLKYIYKFQDKRHFIKKNKIIRTEKILIKLASKLVYEDSISFWKKSEKYKDLEDIAAAHRWSWVMPLLDSKQYSLKKKKFIISAFINNWFVYYSNYKIEKKNVIFEPYTISERLVNFSVLTRFKILDKIKFSKYSLINNLNYLILNMEVYEDKISNHVLNNIRAIYLYSHLINNSNLKLFSIKCYKLYINELMNKDGFFIYGSSHYQFIFTKWILDLYTFSQNKRIFRNDLKKSLAACKFLIIEDNGRFNIPLFGDVSPDFEPEYITSFMSSFFKKEKTKKLFFLSKYHNLLSNLEKKKIIPENTNKSKEWKKIDEKNLIVFNRNPNINGFNFNHAHYDYFHYVLFYKKKSIFVDSGKEDYSLESEKFNLSKYHNSINVKNTNFFEETKNNSLKNKFFQTELFNYKVYKKKNSIINYGENRKFGSYKRKISINKNQFQIKDFANFKKKKNIMLNFFLTNKVKISKLDKKVLINISKNKSIEFLIISNNKFSIRLKKNKMIEDHKKYGDKVLFQKIEILFKDVSKLSLKILMDFS